jgi:hypothetical protein
MTRPAESGGIAGTIGLLIAYIFGVTDAQTVAIIGAGIGVIPTAVTFLVANGGVRGVAAKLWVGNSKTLVKAPKELKG